jgi:hypothetical protein
MKVNSDEFRVREGQAAILKKWPNKVQPNYKTDKQLKKSFKTASKKPAICKACFTPRIATRCC